MNMTYGQGKTSLPYPDINNLEIYSRILIRVQSDYIKFSSRLRSNISKIMRGEAPNLRTWCPIVVTLPVNPSTIDDVLLIWKQSSKQLNISEISVNDVLHCLNWKYLSPGFVYSFLPVRSWHQYENVLSARYPTDWTRLGIFPVRHNMKIQGKIKGLSITSLMDLDSITHDINTIKPQQNDRQLVNLSDEPDELAIGFILRSINKDASSPFQGLVYGCYDLDNQSYRLASWVWTSGIAIAAIAHRNNSIESRDILERIGSAILRQQLTVGEHAGGILVRHDLMNDVPGGYAVWLAPNDASVLAGYGLLSLYEVTKNSKYLEAAIEVAKWILREGFVKGRIRLGLRLELNRWVDNSLYVDAGFTPVLFSKLYSLDNEQIWVDTCRRLIDDLIARLYVGSGIFYSWVWPGRHYKFLFTRGQAWMLDGLIESFLCTKEKKYINIAFESADFLIRMQNSSGSWYLQADNPASGEDNKGTPAISYHLLRLYGLSGDKTYLDSAKQALKWCEDNQYCGSDPRARGGIVSWNSEGAIGTIKNVRTAFPYASAYQLLALKELKVFV